MSKKEYIEQGYLNLIYSSVSMLLPFGSLFFVLLSILDYFVTPENFVKFLIYRLIFAGLGMTLFTIFKLSKKKE